MLNAVRLAQFHYHRGAALTKSNPFKWRHYESEIILLCVRWYLRYSLSYRDLEEMMRERGLSVDHTTIYRWVQAYAPELEKRIRPHLRPINDSYRVDETHVKVKGVWKYLCRRACGCRGRGRSGMRARAKGALQYSCPARTILAMSAPERAVAAEPALPGLVGSSNAVAPAR